MTLNKQILMKTRPVGMPIHENFEIVESTIPEIRHGEVLIKILWLSLDPYMRGRMTKTCRKVKLATCVLVQPMLVTTETEARRSNL